MTDSPDDLLADMDREPTAKRDLGIDRSKWGLFPDVSFLDYFADPAPEPSLSNSGITTLLKETPLDFAFEHPRLNPDSDLLDRVVSKAQETGSVVHRLALGKGADYAVAPFDAFRSKEAKEFRDAAIAAGRIPIVEAKFNECLAMADAIKLRIKRALDGASYETEVVFMYQEETPFGPIWVRGMLDVWSAERAMILDPKVTRLLYDESLGRQMVKMGWDRQATLYPHALGKIFPELAGRIEFADLLIKPVPPFTSRLAAPEKAWRAVKLRETRKAMETFAYCMKEGRWPGFGDDVDLVEMPRWEEARLMADEEDGEE
jgi:hypothetical protein